MRLAIVTTNRNYPWGGAEQLWHALALAARARGWPVLVVAGPLTLDSEPIHQLHEAGVSVVGLPPARSAGGGKLAAWHRFKFRFLGARTGVGARLRHFAPGLLFVNQCGAFDGAWEYWLQGAIKAQRIPYVTITHNNDEQPLNPVERMACAKWSRPARALYFVSEELRHLAETQLAEALPQSAVIQNPFPIPTESNLPPWSPAPPWRMAVVGRLEMHEKGLDLVLAAVARALSGEADWRLSFCGRGPDETRLREAISAHGLADRVDVVGYVANPADIWRDHHLCVLASRWEGFSLVMAEALACARPVLRTRSGGASWIEDGLTGWLCQPDNADALASALRIAWEHRHEWPQMGLAARASLLQQANRDPAGSLLDQLAAITS